MKTLLFAMLFIAAPVFAGESDTASLEVLRQAAEQGNTDAQYELGILYEFGYHFPDHKAAAYAWYSRAAEHGSALAAKRRDVLKAELSAADMERSQALLKSPPAVSAPSSAAPASVPTR